MQCKGGKGGTIILVYHHHWFLHSWCILYEITTPIMSNWYFIRNYCIPSCKLLQAKVVILVYFTDPIPDTHGYIPVNNQTIRNNNNNNNNILSVHLLITVWHEAAGKYQRYWTTYRGNTEGIATQHMASSKLLIRLSEKQCKSWKVNLVAVVAFAFPVIGSRERERLDPYMMCVCVCVCGFLLYIFLPTQSIMRHIINQRNNIERNGMEGNNQ